jgi:hypothetical protein
MSKPEQVALFSTQDYSVVKDGWCSDDWETPPQVARYMAQIALRRTEGAGSENLRWLEPSAGKGNIAQYLPNGTVCVESNPLRHLVGAVPYQKWICGDFLAYAASGRAGKFDMIVGNPPFSLGCEFIAACAGLLTDNGRILFLLPTDYFQASGRAKAFRRSGLCITHKWEIVGRVGYEQEGIACDGRQCNDSVFELRLSSFWEGNISLADPYGRLSK